MTSDLSVSPEEETQISFAQISNHHKIISLPGGMMLMLPEVVEVDRSIQIAALQRTANRQLKYLTTHYTAVGAFTLLVSATLRQKS